MLPHCVLVRVPDAIREDWALREMGFEEDAKIKESVAAHLGNQERQINYYLSM